MRYFDAFAGYGGFSLGIQRAYETTKNSRVARKRKCDSSTSWGQEEVNSIGVGDSQAYRNTHNATDSPQATCIGYSEIDKYGIEIYQKHFPEHKNYGDLTKINAEELPDFDLFVGGFPCQAFSIAGKRKGFDDTRGTLFFDIARILRAKQPRLLLLENVKGLLSHDNGKTFSTIISTLDEIGYDLQWQVLNAKHFGVPQNRERVFIIGHLRGTSRPEVFPIGNSNPKSLEYVGAIMSENNKKWLEDGKQFSRNFPQGQRVYNSNGISSTLASQAGGLGAKTGLYAIKYGQNNPDRNGNTSPDMFTIKAGGINAGVTDGMKIRRLTPLECERLMGIPDNWTEGVSDTQRYKLCGNGVVVNVVEEIMKRVLNH